MAPLGRYLSGSGEFDKAVPLSFGAEEPLRFNGTINKVTLYVSVGLIQDEGADRRLVETRQLVSFGTASGDAGQALCVQNRIRGPSPPPLFSAGSSNIQRNRFALML